MFVRTFHFLRRWLQVVAGFDQFLEAPFCNGVRSLHFHFICLFTRPPSFVGRLGGYVEEARVQRDYSQRKGSSVERPSHGVGSGFVA